MKSVMAEHSSGIESCSTVPASWPRNLGPVTGTEIEPHEKNVDASYPLPKGKEDEGFVQEDGHFILDTTIHKYE